MTDARTRDEALSHPVGSRAEVGHPESQGALAAFTVGEVIGEGGMGIVHTAVQKSLARHVAIKSGRPGSSELVARRILAEAWVTGYLEHPGVVPVYDILKGGTFAPVVVMRQIHGSTWEEKIGDEAWAAAAGVRDLLEQNLRTFVRVCEIVEFAHAKGVVHRDIKPENVMLGSFGEVYLLDWGLAVALADEPALHLPRAADLTDIEGTLHYAAPEMVGLVDSPVSAATDIYLLGSVLHEIATGRAPHDEPTPSRTFESIAASPPARWGSVPPRLAAIGMRAMSRAPSERQQAVSEVRLEVLDFLRSRDSEHLVEEAQRALADLAEACQSSGPRRKIYDRYGECRLAFREALRMWPQNEPAEQGLAAAATLVIEHELQRDPRVACALLEEAQGISPELAARARAAAAAEAEERRRLAKLVQDNDPGIGLPVRRVFFVLFGLTWTAAQLTGDHVGPLSHETLALGALIQLPFLLLAWFGAPDLKRTLYSRRMLGMVGLVIVAQTVFFLIARVLHIELAAARILQIGLWTVIAAALTLLFEPRFWPMTAGLAAGLAVALLRPELRSLAAGLATLGVTINVTVVWKRRGG